MKEKMKKKEQPPVKRPRRLEICAVRNAGTTDATVIWKDSKYEEEKEKKCQRIHRKISAERKRLPSNDDTKEKNSDSVHTSTRDSVEVRDKKNRNRIIYLTESSSESEKEKEAYNVITDISSDIHVVESYPDFLPHQVKDSEQEVVNKKAKKGGKPKKDYSDDFQSQKKKKLNKLLTKRKLTDDDPSNDKEKDEEKQFERKISAERKRLPSNDDTKEKNSDSVHTSTRDSVEVRDKKNRNRIIYLTESSSESEKEKEAYNVITDISSDIHVVESYPDFLPHQVKDSEQEVVNKKAKKGGKPKKDYSDDFQSRKKKKLNKLLTKRKLTDDDPSNDKEKDEEKQFERKISAERKRLPSNDDTKEKNSDSVHTSTRDSVEVRDKKNRNRIIYLTESSSESEKEKEAYNVITDISSDIHVVESYPDFLPHQVKDSEQEVVNKKAKKGGKPKKDYSDDFQSRKKKKLNKLLTKRKLTDDDPSNDKEKDEEKQFERKISAERKRLPSNDDTKEKNSDSVHTSTRDSVEVRDKKNRNRIIYLTESSSESEKEKEAYNVITDISSDIHVVESYPDFLPHQVKDSEQEVVNKKAKKGGKPKKDYSDDFQSRKKKKLNKLLTKRKLTDDDPSNDKEKDEEKQFERKISAERKRLPSNDDTKEKNSDSVHTSTRDSVEVRDKKNRNRIIYLTESSSESEKEKEAYNVITDISSDIHVVESYPDFLPHQVKDSEQEVVNKKAKKGGKPKKDYSDDFQSRKKKKLNKLLTKRKLTDDDPSNDKEKDEEKQFERKISAERKRLPSNDDTKEKNSDSVHTSTRDSVEVRDKKNRNRIIYLTESSSESEKEKEAYNVITDISSDIHVVESYPDFLPHQVKDSEQEVVNKKAKKGGKPKKDYSDDFQSQKKKKLNKLLTKRKLTDDDPSNDKEKDEEKQFERKISAERKRLPSNDDTKEKNSDSVHTSTRDSVEVRDKKNRNRIIYLTESSSESEKEKEAYNVITDISSDIHVVESYPDFLPHQVKDSEQEVVNKKAKKGGKPKKDYSDDFESQKKKKLNKLLTKRKLTDDDPSNDKEKDEEKQFERKISTERKRLPSNDDSKEKNSDSVHTSTRDSVEDRDKRKKKRKRIIEPTESSSESEKEKEAVESTATASNIGRPIKNTACKSFRIEMPYSMVSHLSTVYTEQVASSIADRNRDSDTSSRLSLKRKRIEDALNSSQKKVVNGNKAIPLPHFPLTNNTPKGKMELLMEEIKVLKQKKENLKWKVRKERARSNAFKSAYLQENKLNKELRQEVNAMKMEEERREASLAALPPFDLDELNPPEEQEVVQEQDIERNAEEQHEQPQVAPVEERRGRGRPQKKTRAGARPKKTTLPPPPPPPRIPLGPPRNTHNITEFWLEQEALNLIELKPHPRLQPIGTAPTSQPTYSTSELQSDRRMEQLERHHHKSTTASKSSML